MPARLQGATGTPRMAVVPSQTSWLPSLQDLQTQMARMAPAQHQSCTQDTSGRSNYVSKEGKKIQIYRPDSTNGLPIPEKTILL